MPDANVLIAAFASAHIHHAEAKRWLEDQTNGTVAFGMSDIALSGFVRIITQPGAFKPTAPIDRVLDACSLIRRSIRCTIIRPGSSHWMIFDQLCRQTKAAGKLIPDAWFAALAIENGCTWVTMDGDYARFPGLTWRHFPHGTVRTNAP